MFVRITKDRIIEGGPRKAGEVIAVDDSTGRNLIASRWAVECPAPAAPAPAGDETDSANKPKTKKKEPTP